MEACVTAWKVHGFARKERGTKRLRVPEATSALPCCNVHTSRPLKRAGGAGSRVRAQGYGSQSAPFSAQVVRTAIELFPCLL